MDSRLLPGGSDERDRPAEAGGWMTPRFSSRSDSRIQEEHTLQARVEQEYGLNQDEVARLRGLEIMLDQC
jgi:hypothetical protein